MSRYRRNYVPGATYFFTVVTYHRRPILTSDLARQCLRKAMETVRQTRPFLSFAVVLLPDHLHAVWTLPPDDADYSIRWKRVKEEFGRLYLEGGGSRGVLSSAATCRGERGIWQRRFWEHTCRDDADLKRCVDYVHWNPVKHGLVKRVCDYPWSSFRRFVRLGEYPLDWGGTDPCPGFVMPE